MLLILQLIENFGSMSPYAYSLLASIESHWLIFFISSHTFACKIEITRKWQYGIVACAFIVRILFETFATQIIPLVSIFQSILGGENDYYANYDVQTMLMDLDNEKSGTGIAFLAKLIIDLIIIFNSNKIIKFYDSSKFKTYYFLFIVALFTFIASLIQ